MSDRTPAVWKGMMLRVTTGLILVASPAAAQLVESIDGPVVRMDNHGPGSMHSVSNRSGDGGRRGNDDLRVTQAGDVRQEDRREDRRSNAGGEVRGLGRADQVAGEHGREGRDNARIAQMDRPNRIERAERLQRPERPERPQRPERPDRPERAGRN